MTTTNLSRSLATHRVLDRIDLSVLPGQFLLKDVVLLGAALWSLGESLARRRG